jgi:hypothetical protein
MRDTFKVAELVRLFRSRGHLVARLDPLNRGQRGPWMKELGAASGTRWAPSLHWAGRNLLGST